MPGSRRRRRAEAARAYAEQARSWLEDAARRVKDDPVLLETIADHLTTPPRRRDRRSPAPPRARPERPSS